MPFSLGKTPTDVEAFVYTYAENALDPQADTEADTQHEKGILSALTRDLPKFVRISPGEAPAHAHRRACSPRTPARKLPFVSRRQLRRFYEIVSRAGYSVTVVRLENSSLLENSGLLKEDTPRTPGGKLLPGIKDVKPVGSSAQRLPPARCGGMGAVA